MNIKRHRRPNGINYIYTVYTVLNFKLDQKNFNLFYGLGISSHLENEGKEFLEILKEDIQENSNKPIIAAFNMSNSNNRCYHDWLKKHLGFVDYSEEVTNPRSGNTIKLLIKNI